jgi:hypothetical protein
MRLIPSVVAFGAGLAVGRNAESFSDIEAWSVVLFVALCAVGCAEVMLGGHEK